jgi:peptidoglycan/LPS O-acetylase OafA/YrhL
MHNTYRPDIDGLRALAVIAVIVYHVTPESLPGGFVGVDIFFVISGYLITSLIYKDSQNNNFSFKTFYARRIRRIFPALLCVLFVTLAIGWFILFPDEFRQLGKHILGADSFTSNLILAKESGYFDTSAISKPLLHLWSLGIEEQFYIVWPLAVLLITKFGIRPLFIALLLLSASFTANVYLIHNQQFTAAFYYPVSRFWELMAGSSLAFINSQDTSHTHPFPVIITNFRSNVLSITGLGLLIFSFIVIDQSKPFPGYWALLPISGTVILLSCQNSFINQYIFSHRVLVFIGLISYPLYLFHWPFISFQHILKLDSNKELFFSLIPSSALAIITYKFIESNFRRKQSRLVVPILVCLLGISALIAACTYTGKLSPRNDSQEIQAVMSALKDWEYPKGLSQIKIGNNYFYEKKSLSNNYVLFYGDSHIQQYAPRIIKLINQNPSDTKSVIFATNSGVPPIPAVFELKHPDGDPRFKQAVMDLALSRKVSTVVIGAWWGYLEKKTMGRINEYRYYSLVDGRKHYFDEDGIAYAYKSLATMLDKLKQHGKKVYLLLDNPTGENYAPKAILQNQRMNIAKKRNNCFAPLDKAQNDVRNNLKNIARKLEIEIIDPVPHFCHNGLCRFALPDGTPIYKDGSHLRPFYVREYIRFLDKTIKIE